MPPARTDKPTAAALRAERQARSLAARFQPEGKPRVCGGCLRALFMLLERDNATLQHLRTSCPEFWSAVARFAMASHNPALPKRRELSNELLLAWSMCFKCEPREYVFQTTPLVFDWFLCMCYHMTNYPMVQDYDHFSRRTAFDNKWGFWPTAQEQLFPYGPAQSIANLVAGCQTLPVAAHLLKGLLSIHRPLVFPELVAEPNRQKLITAIVNGFKDLAKAMTTELSKTRRHKLTTSGEAFEALRLNFDYFPQLLVCLCYGHDHGRMDQEIATWGYERGLYTAILEVLNLLDDPMKWIQTLVDILGDLYERLPPDMQRDPPAVLRDRAKSKMKSWTDPYRFLRLSLKTARALRACRGPGCDKTIHENAAGKRFSYCAKCRFTPYCSRECQRGDWTQAAIPHKEICDMLRELFTFANTDMDEDAFAAACHQHCFPLSRVQRLTEWVRGYHPTEQIIPLAVRTLAGVEDEDIYPPEDISMTLDEAENLVTESSVIIKDLEARA